MQTDIGCGPLRIVRSRLAMDMMSALRRRAATIVVTAAT
jgi:hypothetical protein